VPHVLSVIRGWLGGPASSVGQAFSGEIGAVQAASSPLLEQSKATVIFVALYAWRAVILPLSILQFCLYFVLRGFGASVLWDYPGIPRLEKMTAKAAAWIALGWLVTALPRMPMQPVSGRPSQRLSRCLSSSCSPSSAHCHSGSCRRCYGSTLTICSDCHFGLWSARSPAPRNGKRHGRRRLSLLFPRLRRAIPHLCLRLRSDQRHIGELRHTAGPSASSVGPTYESACKTLGFVPHAFTQVEVATKYRELMRGSRGTPERTKSINLAYEAVLAAHGWSR
jgi:hypothetical protein